MKKMMMSVLVAALLALTACAMEHQASEGEAETEEVASPPDLSLDDSQSNDKHGPSQPHAFPPVATSGDWSDACPSGAAGCWYQGVEYNKKRQYYNNTSRTWYLQKVLYTFCYAGLQANVFYPPSMLNVQICIDGTCQPLTNLWTGIHHISNAQCRTYELYGQLPLVIRPGELRHVEMFAQIGPGLPAWVSAASMDFLSVFTD